MAMKMEEKTLINRAMNEENVETAGEEVAHNLIRKTVDKAFDLSKILKKKSVRAV